MVQNTRVAKPGFLEILKRERATVAAGLIVGIALLGLFHAPPRAVLLGCGAAMVLLLVRARTRGRVS
jgi:hypothetical protein